MADRRRSPLRLALIIAVPVVAVAAAIILFVTVLAPKPPATEGGTVRISSVAKDFTLTDQNGRPFHLADARGKPVILSFLSARSTGADQYIALKLRRVVNLLEDRVADVVFVAITTDAANDTQAVRLDYSKKIGMDDHWKFLSGDPAELKKLYAAYDVGISASTTGSADVAAADAAAAGNGDPSGAASVGENDYNPQTLTPPGAPSEGLGTQDRLLALMLNRVFGKAPAATPYPIVWLIDGRRRFVQPLAVDSAPTDMVVPIMSLLGT